MTFIRSRHHQNSLEVCPTSRDLVRFGETRKLGCPFKISARQHEVTPCRAPKSTLDLRIGSVTETKAVFDVMLVF
jgi:hypothetical protein